MFVSARTQARLHADVCGFLVYVCLLDLFLAGDFIGFVIVMITYCVFNCTYLNGGSLY